MKRLVIANRGEIARRIMRGAKRRGYSVAVVATAEDSDGMVCREADAVLTVSSYLDAADIVAKAKAWSADFIHPGYGFLSENADFAAKVEEAGIVFVGPTSLNIAAMGSKESAKKIAGACQVPVLSALFSAAIEGLSVEALAEQLKKSNIHPPYLVKASAGGGGRGMRVVETVADLPQAIRRGAQEAEASFKDGTVFIESYLQRPRHIEIQVFGDGRGGGVFLGERECSLQRRHQKVIEEAPSAVVNSTLREAMGRASLALVAHTKYRGAGTAEFLLDSAGRFWFLEMNTRLQVEHPVTEGVYGVDLVEAQLLLAEGIWPDFLGAADVFKVPVPQGVSLEARILAEDPRQNYMPTPGPLLCYVEPSGPGVRVDSGVCEGGRVNASYDSMISKLIVHGADRAEAVQRMSAALASYVVQGCKTNIPFLQAIVRHPDFLKGNESIAWLSENLEGLNEILLPQPLVDLVRSDAMRQAVRNYLRGQSKNAYAERFGNQQSSWFVPAGALDELSLTLVAQDKERRKSSAFLSGSALRRALVQSTPLLRYSPGFHRALGALTATADCEVSVFITQTDAENAQLSLFGENFDIALEMSASAAETGTGATGGEVRAPMAGKVLEICIKVGDSVTEGQLAFLLESMKMQLEVRASVAGTVDTVLVEVGQILTGPVTMAFLK